MLSARQASSPLLSRACVSVLPQRLPKPALTWRWPTSTKPRTDVPLTSSILMARVEGLSAPKNAPCGRCRHGPERTVNQPSANLSMTSRAARDDVRHKTEIGSTSNSTPATTKPRLGDDEGLRRAGRVRNDSKRRATESEVCCVNPGCRLGHVAGDTAG